MGEAPAPVDAAPQAPVIKVKVGVGPAASATGTPPIVTPSSEEVPTAKPGNAPTETSSVGVLPVVESVASGGESGQSLTPSSLEQQIDPVKQAKENLVAELRAKYRREKGGVTYVDGNPTDPEFDAAVADLETPLEGDDPQDIQASLDKILAAKEKLGMKQGDLQKFFESDDRWGAVASEQVKRFMEAEKNEVLAEGGFASEADAQGFADLARLSEEKFHDLFAGDIEERKKIAGEIAQSRGITDGASLQAYLGQLGYQEDPSFFVDAVGMVGAQAELDQIAEDVDPVPVVQNESLDVAPVTSEDPEHPEPAPAAPDGIPPSPDAAPVAETDGQGPNEGNAEQSLTPEQVQAIVDEGNALLKDKPADDASEAEKVKWRTRAKEYFKRHPWQAVSLSAASLVLLWPIVGFLLVGFGMSASQG